jgi:hypothetical protein
MITVGLNSLEELDKLEAYKQKKHKKKQGRSPSYLFLLVKY